MKDGGAFPINFLEFFADVHPSMLYFEIVILGFGISIQLKD